MTDKEKYLTRKVDALTDVLEKHIDVIEEVLSLKDHPNKAELFEELVIRLLETINESKAILKTLEEE